METAKQSARHRGLRGASVLLIALLAMIVVANGHASEPDHEAALSVGLFDPETLQSSSDEILRATRFQEVVSVLHNTFGYTSLGFALATGLLNPELVPAIPTAMHASFGYTAAGFAAGALATGAIVHANALNPESAEDPIDFVHAMLGVGGGALIVAAPFLAPGDVHELIGILGTSAMGFSILLQILKEG